MPQNMKSEIRGADWGQLSKCSSQRRMERPSLCSNDPTRAPSTFLPELWSLVLVFFDATRSSHRSPDLVTKLFKFRKRICLEARVRCRGAGEPKERSEVNPEASASIIADCSVTSLPSPYLYHPPPHAAPSTRHRPQSWDGRCFASQCGLYPPRDSK